MSQKNGDFCWNELATPSPEEAKKFYGELLGWTFSEHKTGESTYTMIQNKDNTFGGMWHIPVEKQKEIPPNWMGYILVDNLEETLEKAQKLGATVKMPITPAGDMGQFMVLVDPTGAHIAFWQSSSQA